MNANVAAKTSVNNSAEITPEIAAQLGVLRAKLQLGLFRPLGRILLALLNLSRYRNHLVADLSPLLIEPLIRDRVAIAHKSVRQEDGTLKVDESEIAGIAIWATVSDAVDARIREQIKAGAFPVRLGADDWLSGEKVWLLDIIAADAKQGTSVLANFRQLAGERVVKIHPMVGKLIEPEALEKLWASDGMSA